METRTTKVTMDKRNEGKLILVGRAIVFETPTEIKTESGSYTEIISRDALKETDMSDVKLLYNHDVNTLPLARTPKTMQLEIDEGGLIIRAELSDTENSRNVYEAIRRGDLSSMSFGFKVAAGGDEWQGERRRIKKIEKIYECSVVPFPAYNDTSVEARSILEGNYKLELKNKIKEIRKGGIKMKFENVAESFNYYKNLSIEAIEKRTAEIEQELNTNANADVKSLNVELEGMKEARANIEESVNLLNSARDKITQMITGMDAETETAETRKAAEEVTSTVEYRSGFYKSLQGRALDRKEAAAMKVARAEFEKRSNEFNTSTNSAAVIPTATLDEIVKKARKQGGLMSECRAFAVPSKIAIPIGTPTTKGMWHVEGAAVETEKVNPTTVTFEGNEIIKVFSISAKTQTMSINAFERYLVEELEASVMETIGDALVNGTGVGQGTGIMTAFDSDNTITASSTGITYANVVTTVSKLKRGYANGAKWAMNNTTLYTVFYGMVDMNKRPIFIADPKSEGIGKILGFDVIVDDNIADNVVIFGNFGQYLGYNLPGGIVIETSRESSFKSGLIDYRALTIADCKPLVNEAFVKLTVG